MGAFESGGGRRIRKIRDQLRRARPHCRGRRRVRNRAGAGQCAERTILDMRMPRMPAGGLRLRLCREAGMANLERERAVGGRHEAGGDHCLKQQANQQCTGDEAMLAAMEKKARHMANRRYAHAV